MRDWTPTLRRDGAARYLQLADAIATGIADGSLRDGVRLPPQRVLADRLGIDFTTVSRGYAEARTRGLVDSHVGRGTFVVGIKAADPQRELRRHADVDLTMNLPPEPDAPDLLARMQAGLQTVSANLIDLLRYQSSTGGQIDKEAASTWLSLRGLVPTLDRIAVTPGAHPTILAILMSLTVPGDVVLCEDVTYAGIRGICARLGLRLIGLPGDAEGIDPDALDAAIRDHRPRVLYLNPTLNNPTTRTITLARRQAIADVMLTHRLPLIEDDAYGFIPPHPPAPLASFAPDLVWHIGGLAKCIGAGLRVAYTVAPDSHAARDLAHQLKVISVMPSPLMMALATRWITDGTADGIRRFIREETQARQAIAAQMLAPFRHEAAPHAFNVWLHLPDGVTRAEIIGRMAGTGLGMMPSDAFTVSGEPAEAIRVCLGGQITRSQLRDALGLLAYIMASPL
ncbi:DNA-binding transcriptional regulator, MocR family, contains an aminotransferase domain [Loktanella fryxellensis]|uniref:DNA-binding transcriptional regulator, MocR family, contains an aminotransferase domain n=1 Tax=Loktanella fryxellensis TaxID=245187 RepID=A0A1H8HKE9_9RHOB|nr:PLP-dependent aminotransferase family protein [Loktanella fryxellensis]SEN56640.1 DNA-binding transcriptional regulator, MocR family, contains an aminotransferase domain [Loktanella fryxellensis]